MICSVSAVQNRSRELAELLMDVDKIRSERRKAKANRNKYVGIASDNMRYGGFGNTSGYGGGGGGGSYGGGGSGGGGGSSSYDRGSLCSLFVDTRCLS